MERSSEFLARHPGLVALLFALLGGISTYQAFGAGVTYAQLRSAFADEVRVASEALGG